MGGCLCRRADRRRGRPGGRRLARAVQSIGKRHFGKLADTAEQGTRPAMVTSSRRRRFLHTVLAARGIQVPVLSFEELLGCVSRGRHGSDLMVLTC